MEESKGSEHPHIGNPKFPDKHDLRVTRMTRVNEIYDANERYGIEFTSAQQDNNVSITVFSARSSSLDDPANQKFIKTAKMYGLNVYAFEDENNCAQIMILSNENEGTDRFREFDNDFDEHNDQVDRVKNPPPPPLDPATNIVLPSQASPIDHLQYLLDVKHYVSGLGPQKNRRYMQMVHSDAPCVGDPLSPAVLDASYSHYDQFLVSISLPDFLPYEPKYLENTKDHNQGLTTRNIGEAFEGVMYAANIDDLSDSLKIGHDKVSSTVYLEKTISEEKYERGRMIIDALIRTDIRDAQDFVSYLEKGDRIREDLGIPGSRVDFQNDGSIVLDVPEGETGRIFDELGSLKLKLMNDFSQHKQQDSDVRPGYIRVKIDADGVPKRWSAPVEGCDDGSLSQSFARSNTKGVTSVKEGFFSAPISHVTKFIKQLVV